MTAMQLKQPLLRSTKQRPSFNKQFKFIGMTLSIDSLCCLIPRSKLIVSYCLWSEIQDGCHESCQNKMLNCQDYTVKLIYESKTFVWFLIGENTMSDVQFKSNCSLFTQVRNPRWPTWRSPKRGLGTIICDGNIEIRFLDLLRITIM